MSGLDVLTVKQPLPSDEQMKEPILRNSDADRHGDGRGFSIGQRREATAQQQELNFTIKAMISLRIDQRP